MAHILLILPRMELHETDRKHSPTPPRRRVWQDTAAEALLAMSVCAIALTGSDALVLRFNFWLASIVPAYDPMVTMLAVMIVGISVLVLGSIRLKIAAQRIPEPVGVLQRAVARRV